MGKQPDINQAVYLPVLAVNPQAGTLTVAAGYDSLADVGQGGVFKCARWRLYAPPGVDTYSGPAGTLSHQVSAVDSRCLYAGYRYESPLAGLPDWSQTGAFAIPPAIARQQGNNFAGLHYTLHRHYDPVLMRFTSPDPIASPFFNLHHYAGNNPAGAYDPDGLSEVSEYWGNWLRRQGQDEIDEMRASGQHTRAGVNIGIRNFIAGGADLLFGVIHGGYDFTNWLTTGEEMSLTKTSGGLSKRWEARQESIQQSGASKPAQVSAFIVLSFGDLIGSTQLFVEGGAGVNSVNGRQMTVEERATAATEGGLSLFLWSRTTQPRGLKGGNSGEAILAKKFQGQKTTFRDIDIDLKPGRRVSRVREIDNLHPKTRVAHESKVGYKDWNATKYQILKDAALIKSRDIRGAHWHFYRSNSTGRIGADPRVLRMLKHKGIKYTIYGRARQPSSPPAGVLPDFGDD